MPELELVWDAGCPNVPAARRLIEQALHGLGRTPRWTEWRIGSDELPPRLAGYGSPTVLVDGVDVTGEEPSESSNCCRIYQDASGRFRGVPALEQVVAALNAAP